MNKFFFPFFICLILFFSNHTLSQTLSIEEQIEFDSLSFTINESTYSDSIKADAYISILRFYYKSNPDTSIYLSKQAEKLSKNVNYEVCLSDSYGWLGYIYAQIKGDSKQGVYYFKKCLESKKRLKDTLGISSTLNNIGYTFNEQGNLDSALYYYEKSLNLDYLVGNQKSAATSLGNLGRVYLQKGNIIKSIELAHKSLKIREKLDDPEDYISSLLNIGVLYQRFDENEKAIEYFNKGLILAKESNDVRNIALSLYRIAVVKYENDDIYGALKLYEESLKKYEKLGEQNGISTVLIKIGNLNEELDNPKEAKRLYERSIEISQNTNNKPILSDGLYALSSLWFEIGKYDLAEKMARENLILAKEINFTLNIRNASFLLYKIDKLNGNYLSSLSHYETYIKLRDSIMNDGNQSELIRQGFKHDYDKQVALDSLEYSKEQKILQVESDKKDAELQSKRIQQYGMFGGLVFLLIFGGFMYNRFRVTRNQKKIIERQKDEVDIQKIEAEKQRDFAQKEHEEAERQRYIVEEKNTEILDSINYAKRLQDAILPPIKLVKEYFEESFILFRPKDIVSGDFYWMETKKNLIMFAAADCTGHGVPGAMVSVVCANALNKSVNELGKTDPAEILNTTRELVIDTFSKSGDGVKDGMDISLCVMNLDTKNLQWAGANNPLWIIRKEEVEIEVIKPDKQPIGMYGEEKPFISNNIKINEGDTIYMFSDGYADQFGGEKGKKMKSGNFKRLLLENRHENMEQQKQALAKAFESWKGDLEQIDDICVIGVKIK